VRRDRKRDQSREEILDAAQRVLVRDGLVATTLEAVAKEVGLTKAALYYYYPSKDALIFEIVFRIFESHAKAIAGGVESAPTGPAALRAVIDATLHLFGRRMDDFRLAFLAGQVGGPGSVRVGPEQFERIRPLNALLFGAAAQKLADDGGHNAAGVPPRMMAFLACAAALGVLTMKGMVEAVGDPLLYSDAQLVDSLAKVFEAAAATRRS
jgi:AcrR family transcriptional regulator